MKKVSTLKRSLNKIYSHYIRTRDCLKTTKNPNYGMCITCQKIFDYSKLQAGHFLPGRHNSVLYDERNCHAQCYRCNIPLKGNWVVYIDVMKSMYGTRAINALKKKDKELKQFKPYELEALIEIYQQKTDDLKTN